MCGRMGPQGIPLDEVTLNGMSLEERSFWTKFMELAMKEFDAGASAMPIAPSADLSVMYAEAIRNHNGQIYCPVQQMREIFGFE